MIKLAKHAVKRETMVQIHPSEVLEVQESELVAQQELWAAKYTRFRTGSLRLNQARNSGPRTLYGVALENFEYVGCGMGCPCLEDNMKFYATTLAGLKKIVEVIKKGNPPDGMTRQEWCHEISEAFKDCQRSIYRGVNDE